MLNMTCLVGRIRYICHVLGSSTSGAILSTVQRGAGWHLWNSGVSGTQWNSSGSGTPFPEFHFHYFGHDSRSGGVLLIE